MRRLAGRGWVIALAAVAVIAAGFTIAGAQTSDERRGTDPLSPDEEAAALEAVEAADTGGGAEAAGGEVVVGVELHDESKSASPDRRRADVAVYDYADDSLTTSVVNLVTGEVDRVETVRNTQLPLAEEERARAFEIAREHEGFASRLASEFHTATGEALTDPEAQLIVDPIIFLASSMPTRATGAAAACGEHRCAQLMIRTPDGILIDLLPIVDLSDGVLIAEDGFFE
jgi:hypothetical protein